VREPKVFLFDEPLSNLDAQLRNEMRSEIKRLHQRLGATIIYVTHDQVEAMTLADRIAVLSAGHKMQYDTPDTIYHRPAALFVAGFTGAPPMNLVPCVLVDGYADLGGLRVPLPYDLAQRAAGAKALTFGVRPENLRLNHEHETDIHLPAEVQLLEPLGAETLVTLKLGQAEVVARCPAAYRPARGTCVDLHVSPTHLHLFDQQQGRAL
jgi:multiple sugar transport system ATP-binding protein